MIRTEKSTTKWYAGLLLIINSMAIAFFIAEAITRIRMGVPVFAWVDFSQRIVNCAPSFDPHLGWKLEPSIKGVNWEQRSVAILPNGLRSNGGISVNSDLRILAVGDSYTFGAQVADFETWPAALEDRLAIQVYNGGVCGYGVDQTVLRLQELMPRYRPDILIIGITPADIWRTQLSVFYTNRKPYFTIKNSIPALQNVPLDPPDAPLGISGLISRGLAYINDYSLFIHSMPNISGLLKINQEREHIEVHQEGLRVSCQLIERVRDMSESYGVEPYLLMQYTFRDIGNLIAISNGASMGPRDRHIEFLLKALELMECSRSAGVPVIDTFIPLEQLHREEGIDAVGALYINHKNLHVNAHMSASGNAFVANYIAQQIGSLD